MLSNLATSLVNSGARKRHFRLSGRSASERALLSRGRPLLHETLLLGSRNALRTTEHAETQKIAIWRPPPGDPLTMSHFGPPDSIRRRVGRPTGGGGIYQAVWPLPQGQGGAGGRPLLHETLLLGSRNALRTTEHAETQKIAIWRPRPGDPLTMSHFGPPDSIRRRVGRPLSRGGLGPDFPSRPHGQEGHLPGWLATMQGGGLPKGLGPRKGWLPRQCQGLLLLKGRKAKRGCSGPPGRERPSGALERGKKGLSTPSEVPSVTPVRGEGKFEGEGGFSGPPFTRPSNAGVASGRAFPLPERGGGRQGGAAQGSLAPEKAV